LWKEGIEGKGTHLEAQVTRVEHARLGLDRTGTEELPRGSVGISRELALASNSIDASIALLNSRDYKSGIENERIKGDERGCASREHRESETPR